MSAASDGPLPPGSTIGILGAGQLGRMLALAAAPLGLKVAVFAPETSAPAYDVAAWHRSAPWSDIDALRAFVDACDVVTLEFENVPVETVSFLADHVPVRPGARSLALTQDRLIEKQFIQSLGLQPAAFVAVSSLDDLAQGLSQLGTPAILKTRRMGYDGLGQVRINSAKDAAQAWDSIGQAPAVLEALVPFAFETSCILARSATGELATWDLPRNTHAGGILRTSIVPAGLAPHTEASAKAAARLIADGLEHVGVLAVEFFVSEAGTLTVNEIAPRVHNSGHWTIEAARTSQFAQHIRAVAGWPLGPTDLLVRQARMDNLIGEDVSAWPALSAEVGASLHLYGKAEVRPGRKMGHVTRVE